MPEQSKHAADPVGGGRVVEHVVEVADGQVVDRRDRLLVPQQALGRHHDQRLAEVAAHLAAQQVEVLRRRRRHATWMLSSAQSWRNRSSRALECSGPWPS